MRLRSDCDLGLLVLSAPIKEVKFSLHASPTSRDSHQLVLNLGLYLTQPQTVASLNRKDFLKVAADFIMQPGKPNGKRMP